MGAEKTFKTTNWALVSQASSQSDQERLDALGELFETYSPSLIEFLERFYRFPPEKAQEAVQDFISDRFLRGNLLQKANHSRGRFRTFLLAAIRSFVTDRLRSENTQKRKPRNGLISLSNLNHELLQVEDSGQEESVFNDVFARQLIAEAIQRTHRYCQKTRQNDAWEVFFARILGPLFEDLPKTDYATLAENLNLPTARTAQLKLTTVKRIFSRHFRAALADYTANDHEADEELALLKDFLSKNLQNFAE